MDRGRLHAGARARDELSVKEQVVHEAYLARLYEEARANGSLDDPLVADTLAQAYVSLNVLRLHNLRTLTRLGRGEDRAPDRAASSSHGRP